MNQKQTKEFLLSGAQDDLYEILGQIKDSSDMNDIHDHAVRAEAALDAILKSMSKAYDLSRRIITRSGALVAEAEETLEFLLRRNASKESIMGMSVLAYHGNDILQYAEEISSAFNTYEWEA